MSPIRTIPNDEDVEVSICRLSEEWTGLWNSGQLDKVVDLYAKDALYLPAHANPIHGRKNIREFLREPMRLGATDFTLRIDFIQRAGNLAYDVGHYSIRLPQNDGTMKLDQGRYLVVWQRQESGEWRMLVFAAQSSEEPWEQKAPARR
jgi:uncharacterized protein (TIGR02246 family)